MFPVINDYYLNGNSKAFDKHMDDPRTKAIEWFAWGGLVLFVLGLICTMIFVSGNIVRANGMAGRDTPSQDNSIHIDGVDVCCNPQAMTPVIRNAKKGDDLGKGVKPPPMTPVRPTPPPSPPPTPPKK